ncbi:MAG: oligosaccharide flippase family protein [Candidatus Dormibacteria bacterium]|jgi:PST family polysaccharide transporter
MSRADDSSPLRVTVVHLGRRGGLGERRRVEAWRDLLEDAGARVTEIPLMAEHRREFPLLRVADLVALIRRRSVIETAAWDARGAADRLRRTEPDVAVFVTARAYHPRLHGIAGGEVLDFVDRMSSAYCDRAEVVRGRLRRAGFRVLSWSHRGFEAWARSAPVQRVAAGVGDAAALDATWLPIPVRSAGLPPAGAPEYDVLFFGSLGYPPNVDAVRRLARAWPLLQARRPGISVLLAGATPTSEVRGIAAARGWHLSDGFQDVTELCARARLAVVPLDRATGIQIKVLEAAAAGLPQVVSPAALRGLEPGFPALIAHDDPELVEGVLRLIDDVELRRSLGEASRRHVRERYSVESWRHVVAALLGLPGGARKAPHPAAELPAPVASPGVALVTPTGIGVNRAEIRVRAVRGGVITLVRSGAVRGIAFIGMVLIARLVGPEQLGLFVIVSFAVGFLGSIGDGGLAAALIQQDHTPTAEEMSTVFTVQLLIASALCAAATLAGILVSTLGHAGGVAILVGVGVGVSVPITSLKTIPAARLERQLRYGPLAAVDSLQALVFQGAAVALACMGLSVTGFVIAALAQAAVGSLAITAFSPWWLQVRLSRTCLRRLLGFGAIFQAQTVVTYAKDAITPVFVGAVAGAAAVGYLNWAYMIGAIPLLVSYPLSDVTFSLFARARSDPALLQAMVERIIRLSAVTVLPVSVITLVTGARLVDTLFGSRWSPALPSLYLFAITMWAGPVFASSFFSLYYAAGRGRVALAFTVAWTVADWAIGVPLVLGIGFVGIAWRGLIVSVVSAPFALWQVRRVVAIRLTRQVLPGVGLALALGALAWVVYRVLPMTALGTCAGLALTLVVFAAAALFMERDTARLVLDGLWHGFSRDEGPGRPQKKGLITEVR